MNRPIRAIRLLLHDRLQQCESNSIGRVLSFQVRCCGFDPRLSLVVCAREGCANQAKVKFCSRKCAATANNVGRRRHGNAPIKCRGCEELILFREDRKYCSVDCRQTHEIELWFAGELDGCWKYTHASYVRRFLEEKQDGKCLCGFDTTRPDGSSILQVDHIDGNWRNNRPENVRLLCPNCHALTETWGAGNMGNGRTWKREYNQFSPKN